MFLETTKLIRVYVLDCFLQFNIFEFRFMCYNGAALNLDKHKFSPCLQSDAVILS